MKELPGNYRLFDKEQHVKKPLHWEKHPHNGKEYTIIGETIPIMESHGNPCGGNRWIVEYEGRITDISKMWFE